ncbi:hypothetical protein ACH4T9_12470 [Micromonospora sp. NPDC020750]|uniref:hypothetical protein n=1 Tax=unclassified Micromonospora TaxID=2617518 RepID=UPI0037A49B64
MTTDATEIAAVWGALMRAGIGLPDPAVTAAQYVDRLAAHRDQLQHRLAAVERYADQLRADAGSESEDAVAVGLLRAADGLGDLFAVAGGASSVTQ